MRQIAMFIGHGSPLNTITDNSFTQSLRRWGEGLQPRAILCISAHWYGPSLEVGSSLQPELIYDFGGFPAPLYQLQYPCPGSPAVAERVKELLPAVTFNGRRGLDHGAWAVLLHLFPKAEIPVVQLSAHSGLSGREHWALAEKLKPLRDEGVLIIGSGNLVHSFTGIRGPLDAPVNPLGQAFEETMVQAMESGDCDTLVDYQKQGASARFAAPTPDHYWPLLYPLAVREKNEPLSFPFVGFQYGSMSMRCVQVG